jgi:hypothetical protein
VLGLVVAVAIPTVLARPAVAFTAPTLTLGSTTSGGPGTSVTYTYTWNATDCGVSADSLVIQLFWDKPDPNEMVGSAPADANCSGTVVGIVPNDTTRGDDHYPSASLFDNTTGVSVANSQNVAPPAPFLVTPAPTPPPTPTPTPRPTPRPTPTPTHPPTFTPTPVPTSTAIVKPPRPAPTPLPTPTPFVIGGGGGGSGGGSPQGGAACSAGLGRSPSGSELASDTAELAGADPTALEMQILSSPEYYRDAGGNSLGFVTRLYDDVLRHDPTPVEVATSLQIVSSGGDAARSQLVEDVVLSPEARAIRVDQVFHTLLKTYPGGADLALWVNRMSAPGVPGVSQNYLVLQIAASAQYYTLAGGTASSFMTTLFQDLLNTPPTDADLSTYASLMAKIQTGTPNLAYQARENVVQDVLASGTFRVDEVISFFTNYLHPTCRELMAQECVTTIATPTSAQLAAGLADFSNGMNEEGIIAAVLGSDQYYQNHGSNQTGLIKGAYQDLLGRAPTTAELATALSTYTNDQYGHLKFGQAMVALLEYQNLVVSLDYQQLLMRGPFATEVIAGQGILAGDVKSVQTPDELLIEVIASTPEYYADTGGTASRFVAGTIATLLMRSVEANEETALLNLRATHDTTWQGAVALSLLNGAEYRTYFIRGIYAKFLSYSVCAVDPQPSPGGGPGGFLKGIPGGWFGLGAIIGVLLIGAAAAVFFTLERRRFSRLYPQEIARHRE